jgi:pimeloyl-ACP methyl ester carboxylesterase
MPFARNADGVRVHFEVVGKGPPILLHHGFGSTPERWRWEGYVQALEDGYTLILMAARGHGLSDKPHGEEAYAWERRIEDVCNVLDALDLERVTFWGYSMGGRTGFGMLKLAPQRLSALVIGGSAPYQRTNGQYEERIEQLRRGMLEYIVSLESRTGAPMPEARRRHYESMDAEALIALTRANAAAAGFEAGLEGARVPALLYCGTEDAAHEGAGRAAAAMPNASFVSLPGLTHRTAIERSDLVLPHVLPFLEKVTVKAA